MRSAEWVPPRRRRTPSLMSRSYSIELSQLMPPSSPRVRIAADGSGRAPGPAGAQVHAYPPRRCWSWHLMLVGIPATGARVPSATSDVPLHSSLPTASAPAPPGPSTDAPFWRAPIRSTLLDRGARVAPAELERRVEARAAELGERRLVLLRGTAELALVVDLLACPRARCPVILPGPSDADDELVDRFDPDVVLDAAARPQGSRLVERRPGSAHELHRDLALLLSTSGSTGAPKLVRLSRRNLASNAAAIASYLRLDAG